MKLGWTKFKSSTQNNFIFRCNWYAGYVIKKIFARAKFGDKYFYRKDILMANEKRSDNFDSMADDDQGRQSGDTQRRNDGGNR